MLSDMSGDSAAVSPASAAAPRLRQRTPLTLHLERLLYVSRPTAVGAAHLARTMEDILVASHRRNTMRRVTGFLWSDGASFVQALEGPGPAVQAVYSHILVDPRHRDVTRRLVQRTPDRMFPGWSMSGITLSDLDDALVLAGDAPLDPYASPPEALLAMLQRIAQTYGERLDLIHQRIAAAA